MASAHFKTRTMKHYRVLKLKIFLTDEFSISARVFLFEIVMV
jgi:hypothetical protein